MVVDAGGVGYDVTVPISTYSALPAEGAEVRLRDGVIQAAHGN